VTEPAWHVRTQKRARVVGVVRPITLPVGGCHNIEILSGLSQSLLHGDVSMDPRARERAECRRPIADTEVPFLEALGRRLVELRRAAGFTRWDLAQRSKVSESTVARIERGTRRTRRSTLERIAGALGMPERCGEFAALAGPALAPESVYADRVTRRRERRWRRARHQAEQPKPRQGVKDGRQEVDLLVAASNALQRAKTLEEISAARQLLLGAIALQ
jgi:transcriptional regulator with XRE-family HTH domain